MCFILKNRKKSKRPFHPRESCWSQLVWSPGFCSHNIDFGPISCWNWTIPVMKGIFGRYNLDGWIDEYCEIQTLSHSWAQRLSCEILSAPSISVFCINLGVETLLKRLPPTLVVPPASGTWGWRSTMIQHPWESLTQDRAKKAPCKQRGLKLYNPVTQNRQHGKRIDFKNCTLARRKSMKELVETWSIWEKAVLASDTTAWQEKQSRVN